MQLNHIVIQCCAAAVAAAVDIFSFAGAHHQHPSQAVHKLSSSKEIFCVIKYHFYSEKKIRIEMQ